MATRKKSKPSTNTDKKSDEGKMLEEKTYEDYNEEKPLPHGPYLNIADEEVKSKLEIKMYSCAKHPEVQSTNPGICPQCGIELIVIN